MVIKLFALLANEKENASALARTMHEKWERSQGRDVISIHPKTFRGANSGCWSPHVKKGWADWAFASAPKSEARTVVV
jgi:hypothetical protein